MGFPNNQPTDCKRKNMVSSTNPVVFPVWAWIKPVLILFVFPIQLVPYGHAPNTIWVPDYASTSSPQPFFFACLKPQKTPQLILHQGHG